jgi:uncharacterized protein YutE (UPF0331/DUF86 family)
MKRLDFLKFILLETQNINSEIETLIKQLISSPEDYNIITNRFISLTNSIVQDILTTYNNIEDETVYDKCSTHIETIQNKLIEITQYLSKYQKFNPDLINSLNKCNKDFETKMLGIENTIHSELA